jgi:hypothetical protein
MAGGTVKQIITFDGVDNASKAADSVKKSMRGLSDEAKRASDGTAGAAAGAGKAIDTVREKSGDVESALKGISDFAGGASDQVSKMGDSFGAVEATMRLLPGPIGLVATGITAAALGAKLLNDYLTQTAAKANLLTSATGGMLAEKLNLGADAAVRLSQAFADLGEKAVRPSDLLLQQVAENAKALGADPAENVAKFIAAWKDGPEAVRKVQSEIGKLNTQFQTIEQVGEKLGFDTVALGLKATVSPVEQIKAALTEISQREGDIAAAQAKIAANEEARLTATVNQTIALDQQNAALKATVATQQANIDLARLQADTAKNRLSDLKLLTEGEAIRNARAQNADIRIMEAGSKQEAQKIKLALLADQLKSVEFDIAAIQGLQTQNGKDFAKEKLAALQLTQLQLQAQQKQIADTNAAEEKATAAAAAREARARREAAAAKAEREAEQRHDEWRKGIDAIKRERDRLDAQAVRERVAGLNLERAQVGAQVEGEIRATLEVARIKRQAASDIAALQTDETLNRQARALETKRIEIEAETAVAAVRAAESKRIEDEGAKAFAALKTRAQDLIAIAAPAAEAAQAVAGPNGLGGALAEAAKQGSKLAASWSATEGNASGIIGAVGGVAAAVVEGEKQKAAVLGVMEAAQAIALAFVPGKQAEAAAHGAAALMYGGIATGLLGGSSTSGATAGATGGGFAEQAVGATAPGTVQAVGTTVINFNAPLATRYEIGKDVVAAQKAAKAWAKAPAGV